MENELDRTITELEDVTTRLLGITCWEQSGAYGELLKSRGALAAHLMDRQDLDARAVERIDAVIQAGNRLVAPLMAMRQSILKSLEEAGAQRCYSRGLGSMLSGPEPVHRLDLKA